MMNSKKISNREKQILTLIAQEYTGKEIAKTLFISLNTVETHRGNILQKLNAKNTAGMIIKSIERNILQLPISVG